MVNENQIAAKIPSILALLFVTLHLSAFVSVTILQFRHVYDLEKTLSVRRADIDHLTGSCGSPDQQSLGKFKRSLDHIAKTNADFQVTWRRVNSRQTSSVSSLMSSVLLAQEQQLIQKCSGDVKICLSGDVGNKGDKGDKGLLGTTGDTGARGPSGVQGPVGLKGDTGASGTTGSKGVSGRKGSVGPHGPKGETGNSGPKGTLGPSGALGPTGAGGDGGENGDKGSIGPKGDPGLKGKQGTSGSQGPVGLKGEVGDVGPDGAPAVYSGPVCDCVAAPYLSSSQDTVSGTLGTSLNLSCLADGSPASSVTWYKISQPGCKINGTSGNVLTIANLEPSDIGQYVCVASNSHGNASKTVDVTTSDSMQVMDCNFENRCRWINSENNQVDMTIHTGPTRNPSTGPNIDHTLLTAAGYYLYLESLATTNQISRIESMTVPANQIQCFTMWYNMYGRTIGNLEIYKQNCGNSQEQLLWNKAGNQGPQWQKVSVTLPADPENGVKLIIQATAGANKEGDIAIDDLSLTDGPCNVPLPVIAGPSNVSLTTTIGAHEVLSCNASGNPDPTITWSKPTSCHTLSETGNSHSINAATFADGGKYTCTATNTAGNATHEITVTINGNLTCPFEQNNLCGWSSETPHTDTWLFHSGNTASSGTGPTNDHTKGNSIGTYLYMEASSRSPNDTVVLVSPDLPAMNDVCLTFWYNMNGAEIGSLNIYTKDCRGVKTKILSFSGDKGDVWRHSCSKVAPLDYQYNLLIEGVIGSGYRGDIAIDDVQLSSGGSCVCPSNFSSCDFEIDTCTWTQDKTDNFDWILNSGATASLNTGPSGDHTTGAGKYVYIEASSPQKSGHVARLLSPVLETGQQYCLDYWYNMHGANMGSLSVYTKSPSTQTRLHTLSNENGDKGNTWLHGHLTIPAERLPFQVVFEGRIGTDYSSDMALDDVKLSGGHCQ